MPLFPEPPDYSSLTVADLLRYLGDYAPHLEDQDADRDADAAFHEIENEIYSLKTSYHTVIDPGVTEDNPALTDEDVLEVVKHVHVDEARFPPDVNHHIFSVISDFHDRLFRAGGKKVFERMWLQDEFFRSTVEPALKRLKDK
jgi:hypothetical protein